MPSPSKACKGCGSFTRKLPHPGPRCGQCHREVKASRARVIHEAYVFKTYGLGSGQYDQLFEAQGRRCYICERATGKTRRLAVDHDHKTGFVRGLLCKPCNSMLAHLRDDLDMVTRTHNYLAHPPAFEVVGKVKP